MIADLHTHTNASDGQLNAQELAAQAAALGIDVLSITDHDTVDADRSIAANAPGLPRIVPGIELSTQWSNCGIHVLGLNIDLGSDALATAIAYQGHARMQRAEQIAGRFERAGVFGTLEGAQMIAGKLIVGRPHFAQYLVDSGHVKDAAQAFRRYLGAGKIGDVKQHWATLTTIIDWIRASGGTAVLAHPGKYGLTRARRTALIEEFKKLGGQGLEIVSGRQDPALTDALAAAAKAHGLLASAGSDFHQPGQPWARLGMPLDLPRGTRPVWEAW
jgi:predicted metal-dependent phosphoesterase TrpH